ncbi:MAG: calcium-binding protein [Selenomonadaceae bacterium]|nr:calcium-binding protein [Selenomonadaceae bacterium]
MRKNFFTLQLFAAKKINLTNKADNYENSTANRIIYALKRNDSISNYAGKVTIFGGAGNDSIKNDGSNLTVTDGGNNVKIFGDAGKDYIENYEADKIILDGGANNDSIKTWYSDFVTITGGKGNDSIQLGAFEYMESETAKNTVIKYAEGDGNDTIWGFDSNDTLHITKGTYSTSIKGNDFIVNVGKQKITLKDAVGSEYEKIIIKNSKGKLDIYNDWKTKTVREVNNRANNVTLKSAKSGSYIKNYGDKVKIVGNNGFDEILNYGNNVTISGGKNSDSISSNGDRVFIDAGADNDNICSTGDNSTVKGGKGNDFIDLGYVDQYSKDSQKTVVQYANGDGNDTIRGFNETDTLKIISGSYSVSVNSDIDVIIKVGKGSITLKNAAGQNIYITNEKGKTEKYYFPTVSSGSEFWFADENNFVTSDNISEITENNLTPTSLEKISDKSFENLTNENKLITFSEK